MDSDSELLAKAVGSPDLLRSVLYDDKTEDWKVVRELGEFFIRVQPAEEIMGHALLARSYRHLGSIDRALIELDECRVRVPHPADKKMFDKFIADEEVKLKSLE
jgi:hypothetical protein